MKRFVKAILFYGFLAALVLAALPSAYAAKAGPALISPMPPHPALLKKTQALSRKLGFNYARHKFPRFPKKAEGATRKVNKVSGSQNALVLLVDFNGKAAQTAGSSFDTLVF